MKADLLVESLQISDKLTFNEAIFEKIKDNFFVEKLWPVIYIISDDSLMQAYVGESANVIMRMKSHLKNPDRNKLTTLYIITSKQFNKSATLDIEANLIRYISGDGRFKLLNGNAGLILHNYYQKDDYFKAFTHIWSVLEAKKFAGKTINEISISDLFIYSPYKSLNEDQYASVKEIIKALTEDSPLLFVEGGAGTGKTVLAVFLVKLLTTSLENLFDTEEIKAEELGYINALKLKFPNPKVGLVIPMPSLRDTLKKVFRQVDGLSPDMVIGPADVVKERFDILIVDESHRLRQRINLPNFDIFDNSSRTLGMDTSKTELDWVEHQSTQRIYFYDALQTVKPTDVNKKAFNALLSQSVKLKLKSQLRVKGGLNYMNYLEKLLQGTIADDAKVFAHDEYEFLFFDSFKDMKERIDEKEKETGLSRLVAGHAWEWKSKKDETAFDFDIEGVKLRWNSEIKDWINKNKPNEVGSIHAVQGYDLNYAGVILGSEISYNPTTKELFVISKSYLDKKGKNGATEKELHEYIINIYRTLMSRGIKGTYVYVADVNLRKYLREHITVFKKQITPNVITLEKARDENSVPYYDIAVAAGAFSNAQQAPVKEWIKLPEPYTARPDYFICRVSGESMNEVIPNGALCLFQRDPGGSRENKIVLVSSRNITDPDFETGYTVKSYHSTKQTTEEGWSHTSITLKPMSDQPYDDIVLTNDESTELKVIGIFIGVLRDN